MHGRDVEFLFEVGSLRHVPRGWRQHFGTNVANDLEHSVRVAWIALMLARREKVSVDEGKIFKMALLHDIAETRTADMSYVQKVYTKTDEHQAAADLFAGTSIEDYVPILHEYEKRESLEAKLVKDADNLDVDIELKEFEEQGHQLPKKWAANRRMVRDTKLYTEAARIMWDEIQTADPASWHLNANKWLKMPNAGK